MRAVCNLLSQGPLVSPSLSSLPGLHPSLFLTAMLFGRYSQLTTFGQLALQAGAVLHVAEHGFKVFHSAKAVS